MKSLFRRTDDMAESLRVWQFCDRSEKTTPAIRKG